MAYRILIGDVLERLGELPDESVHCVVTSPPYWGLRDYGTGAWDGGDVTHVHDTKGARGGRGGSGAPGKQTEGSFPDRLAETECSCGAVRVDQQIGLEKTPAEFVAKLVAVFREVRRVLRSDGTCWVNLGDSYFSSGVRHTGRNDSDRETPGGRGGSFRGGDRHAISYDTSDKEQLGSRPSDCLSESLCDGCRDALMGDGIPRSSHSLDAAPSPLPSKSSRAHTESEPDHLPTSDSSLRADRNVTATLDQKPSQEILAAELHGVQESTTTEPLLRQQDSCSHCAVCQACLLVLRSSPRDASLCDRRGGYSGGREIFWSDYHSQSRDVLGLAYPYFTTASLKPKDMVGIPWRLAFALQADGWWLRQDIIWSKPNPMPESVTDRCTKAHEYLFLLTKSARYFYDAEAIKESVTGGAHARMGGETGVGFGHEYDEVQKPRYRGANPKATKAGQNSRMGVSRDPRHADYPKSKQNESFSGAITELVSTRNKRSVWEIATEAFPEAHFATFPTKLVEPCILAGTSEKGCCEVCGAPWVRMVERTAASVESPGSDYGDGAGRNDGGRSQLIGASSKTIGWEPSCECAAGTVGATVLDPFNGSATTGLVALANRCNYIGIELNPEYAAMSERRLSAATAQGVLL